MPSTAAPWREVEWLLDRALDLPPPERVDYLGQECTGRPALLREVETILRCCDAAPGFLDRPIQSLLSPLLRARLPRAFLLRR